MHGRSCKQYQKKQGPRPSVKLSTLPTDNSEKILSKSTDLCGRQPVIVAHVEQERREPYL
jgi:hypothetical protein